METIIKRAHYIYPLSAEGITDGHIATARASYIRGASEQKQIDIDKTCEWLTERLQFGCHPCNGINLVKEFRKTMEE